MDLQVIQNKIFEVRGCRVMLDFHLAELYQVETRALKQAVKRNIGRFPSDFMFVLSKEEANLLLSIGVSQNVIPPDYNFGAALPMAFTEQGVAMLSHAFIRLAQPDRHRGEHFHHAGICPYASDGRRV